MRHIRAEAAKQAREGIALLIIQTKENQMLTLAKLANFQQHSDEIHDIISRHP